MTGNAVPKKKKLPRLFVLDTNVLMHDPLSLFQFQEHDVCLPMQVLEELDNHKVGMTEVARNARQASRYLDQIVQGAPRGQWDGYPLRIVNGPRADGRLYVQTQAPVERLPATLSLGKADNQILEVLLHLNAEMPERDITLVSKDINIRIKARSLGLSAEDYRSDRTLADTDVLPSGARALPDDFWNAAGAGMRSWQDGRRTFYRIEGGLAADLVPGEFVWLEGDTPFAAVVAAREGRSAVLKTLIDYACERNNVWGITARNREQNFALNLLMDPDIDFVTLLGHAGTGKTLLTLAATLSQVIDDKRYTEIIMTRVTVPLGNDIGFLPGTEEEKMLPWMGALEDNLEVLAQHGDGGRFTAQQLRAAIRVKSLNFMRGRTFLRKVLIIDEAQNLTPKQMKALITRAGPGTKVICLGNVAQIDTPYLTEGSSGLSYVVDRFRGWPHGGHVTLMRGERSRLADFASDAL